MVYASFADLKDKVCVITGGAGILGGALTEALAAAGVKTAILDLLKEPAAELAWEIEKKIRGRK
jgi:NAD(P)-dependent dehydrogenase (short-subunit alcohol dehydrogenase family)